LRLTGRGQSRLHQVHQQRRDRDRTSRVRIGPRQSGISPESAGSPVDFVEDFHQPSRSGGQLPLVIDNKANRATPGSPVSGGGHEPLLPPTGCWFCCGAENWLPLLDDPLLPIVVLLPVVVLLPAVEVELPELAEL
jgi:hypothetical protein